MEEFKKCFKDLDPDSLEDPNYFFEGLHIMKFIFGSHMKRGDVIGDIEILKKKSVRESTVVATQDLHVGYLTIKEFIDILEPK